MADELEGIGGVAVTISGDYSQLMTDLQTSQDLAANAGTEIAAALESGASGAQSLTDATEQLAGTWQDTGDAAHYAAQNTEELAEGVKDSGEKAHEAGGAFGELGEKLVDLAVEMGVVVGAGELIKETFSAFSHVESATVALTALTGSAETAKAQIEQLEQMAADENLSFPALLEANQRMVAFGFEAQDIPAALQAAADAATALDSDVSATANSIDRMAASGMAGARQLVSLGLTTADLASTMGVAQDEVKKAFAALDQSTRLEVLTAALDKFSGQAAAGAKTLRGEWQGVKNTFEGFFVTLGDFLEPAAKQILTFFNTIGTAAEVFTLAIEINLEKVGFYFDKFTGQADAANAKALEINANAEKFRKLVSGETPEGPGSAKPGGGGASDLAGLQAKIKKELANADLWILDPDKLKPIQDATSDMAILTDQLDSFLARQKAITKEVADFKTEMEAAGHSMDAAGAAGNYFYQQAFKAADGMAAAQNSIPPLLDDLGNFTVTGERTAEAQKKLNTEIQTFNKSLDGMEGQIRPPFDALHDVLAKIDKDYETGGLAKIPGLIRQLATDDLPTAVQEQQKYVSALEAQHSAIQKITSAQRELLTLEFQLAQERGQSTTKYATALALIDVHTKNLGFTTHNALGTIAAGAIQTVDSDLSKVGATLSKTILEGGSLGKTFHQVFMQMGEDLLGLVLNSLVKMGEEFVVEKLTEKAVGSATNTAAVTSAAAVGFANAFAATAAIPIIGPALAPGVAAETMAAILAVSPMAAFEQGGYVPETMLALVHKGEYINTAQEVQDAGSGRVPVGGGMVINIGALHGVTRDTADALAKMIARKARLVGAFH